MWSASASAEIPLDRARGLAAAVPPEVASALGFAAGRIRAFPQRATERERALVFEDGG